MVLLCQSCSAPTTEYSDLVSRRSVFTHIPNPLARGQYETSSNMIPKVARMRKACFGCASCEKFVKEPPLMPSSLSSLARRTLSARSLVYVFCFYLVFLADAGPAGSTWSTWSAGSAGDGDLNFSDCGFSLGCILSCGRKYLLPFLLLLGLVCYLNTPSHIALSSLKADFSSVSPANEKRIKDPSITSKVRSDEYKKWVSGVMSDAIRCKTISYDAADDGPETTDYNELKKLHKLLETSFPKAHKALKKEVINGYSLLYTLEGTDKSLKPVMFCSHLDVVPAPNAGETPDLQWQHPPFGGEIIDGVIWGRGAIDNKHNVIGQMAAIELLVGSDPSWKPARTIVVAMGHDEEISGWQGAKKIAQHLLSKSPEKNQFEAIYDEGPMMVQGALPGFKGNAALIANAEKGYVTLELRVDTKGGHSSMPPIKEEGAISIIAKAVTKIEANPCPARFSRGSNMQNQLKMLSPMFSTPMRVVSSNLWLFGPLLKKVLLRASNGAAAMLRTTTAVTVIRGGEKENVLPYTVKAYINHRLHPEDTVDDIIAYDKRIINDPRIKVSVAGGPSGVTPPSKISSLESKGFRWAKETVSNVFNNASTCSLMIGNTDTRHYWDLSDNIYRFSPVNLHVKDLGMFHGLNERISVEGLADICLYYRELMLRSQESTE